jgi:hypothetical protein
MKITITTKPAKSRPKLGDRKVVKGVLCERQWEKCHNHRGEPIGYNFTGGRTNYVWVPVP